MNLPHRLMNPRAQGIACVIYSVLIWAGWMIVSSYSVRGSLTAFDITALRFGVSGAIFMPILFRRGLKIGPIGWKGSFWLAMLMGAPFNILTIFGMKFAPASHASGIINTTMLTITTLCGIFLLREKTTKLRIAGIVLSVTGIACMLFAGDLQLGSNSFLGHMFFIAGGVLWAGYVVSIKAWKANSVHAAAAVCSLSFILYLPIYILFLHPQIGMHNIKEVIFQGAYQGIFNAVFALLCFNRGVAVLGATTASAFLPLVPALATLLAIPFLHEMPNALEWAGIGCAALGVLLATGILGKRSKPTCAAVGTAITT